MKYKLIEDKNGTIVCKGKRYRLEKVSWLCYNKITFKRLNLNVITHYL